MTKLRGVLLLFLITLVINSYTSRQLSSFEESIPINYEENHPVVEVILGNPPQKFSMQVDTTESISWVPSVECTNCFEGSEELPIEGKQDNLDSTLPPEVAKMTKRYNGRYNDLLSSTSQDKNVTVVVEGRYGDVEGISTYDSVQLGENMKGIGFQFVRGLEFKNYTGYPKGSLGLSLGSRNGIGYSLLDNLQRNSVIQKKIYALSSKQLYLGNYPSEVEQFLDKYHECNTTLSEGLDDMYRDGWICDLTHILIDNSNNFDDTEEIDGRIIFDSTFSGLSAPLIYLPTFQRIYFNDDLSTNKCLPREEHGDIEITCESVTDFKDLNLLIAGYSLRIPVEKLFTERDGKYVFNISFVTQKHNLWVVGKVLLEEYTLVFDAQSKRVGFWGDHKVKFQPQWNEWLQNKGNLMDKAHFRYLMIAASALGAILIIVVLCAVAAAMRKKYRGNESGPLVEDV